MLRVLPYLTSNCHCHGHHHNNIINLLMRHLNWGAKRHKKCIKKSQNSVSIVPNASYVCGQWIKEINWRVMLNWWLLINSATREHSYLAIAISSFLIHCIKFKCIKPRIRRIIKAFKIGFSLADDECDDDDEGWSSINIHYTQPIKNENFLWCRQCSMWKVKILSRWCWYAVLGYRWSCCLWTLLGIYEK